FVVGDMDLADAAAGSGREHADVVCNLHQANRDGLERAMGFDDGIVRGEGFELIGSGDEGEAGEGSDLFCDIFRIIRRGVYTGADSGAAEGKLGEMGEGVADGLEAVVELRDVTTKLLPESKGGSVHKVGAADLYRLHKGLAFCREGIAQGQDAGNGGIQQDRIGGDVHGRRKGVVGRLRLVDVVVGMEDFLLVGELSAGEYMSAIRND